MEILSKRRRGQIKRERVRQILRESDGMLSVAQAAERIGCTHVTVQRYAQSGKLLAHRMERAGASEWRIVPSSVEKLIAERSSSQAA
jgi:excisionase family DNA binding protein